MRFFFAIVLQLIAFCFFSSALHAHEVEQHFIRLILAEDHMEARLEMDAGYALPELRDQNDDTLPNGRWFDGLSDAEKKRIKVEGLKYLRETLHFHLDGLPIETTIDFAKWGTDWAQYFDQRPDTFMRMAWDIRWDYAGQNGDLELFWLENKDGPSLALAVITATRKLPLVTVSQQEVYSIAAIKHQPDTTAPLITSSSSPPLWSWLKQGFLHVIPRGLDHILFILGLFLLSPKLKPLLTQSLVFTAAHSITLGLTVAGTIPSFPQIIEPLIALSIAYVALENLFLKELKPWRLVLIFALGLLHGMGFGSVMRELPLEANQLLIPIIGFNIGVEAAQLTLLLLAVVLTFWWQEKKAYQHVRLIASLAIAATGIFWTCQRIL